MWTPIDEALAKLRDPTVKVVDFAGSDFDDEDAKRIAQALPGSSVVSLDLVNNKIGDEGAKALAAALPSSCIKTLYLSINNIGDIGAEAIAAALPASVLIVLHLYNNRIGTVGATALAAALPASTITSIDLNANPLSDEERFVCEAIRDANIKTMSQVANEIKQKGSLVPEKIPDLKRLIPAVWEQLRTGYDTAREATEILLWVAEHSCSDEADTRDLILRILPLPKAKKWLEEKDITLTLADFVNEKGALPVDRFLCQGGIPALFAQEDLWDTSAQVSKALRHLPPEQKAFIPNLHVLTAKLSKRVVVHAGPEVG